MVKAKEKEMKDEKEAARQVRVVEPCVLSYSNEFQQRIEAIRTKRAAKEERLRYAKMEETMHKKRVDRLRRREKRNKMLKS